MRTRSFRRRTQGHASKRPSSGRRRTFEPLEKRELLAVVVPDSVLSIGGTLNDGGRAIAVDTAGNYYLAGGFRDTVDFDPGAVHVGDTDILTTDGPQRDIFVARYQADGSLDWARRFGGTGFDNEWLGWQDGDVQVDSSGNTYVLCDFYGAVTFGGDPSFGDAGAFAFTSDSTTDHVMLRFDTDGKLEWATWFGGAEVGGFALDGSGSVFVAGAFTGTRQFGSEQLTAISAKSARTITTRMVFSPGSMRTRGHSTGRERPAARETRCSPVLHSTLRAADRCIFPDITGTKPLLGHPPSPSSKGTMVLPTKGSLRRLNWMEISTGPKLSPKEIRKRSARPWSTETSSSQGPLVVHKQISDPSDSPVHNPTVTFTWPEWTPTAISSGPSTPAASPDRLPR